MVPERVTELSRFCNPVITTYSGLVVNTYSCTLIRLQGKGFALVEDNDNRSWIQQIS